MLVELEGDPDSRGMLMDFKKLKRVLAPLVDAWDHATLIARDDHQLLSLLEGTGWKHVVLPFDTTSENMCLYVAEYLCREGADELHRHQVRSVKVRIEETDSCYAEVERIVLVRGGDSVALEAPAAVTVSLP